jgi:hypothetical protein
LDRAWEAFKALKEPSSLRQSLKESRNLKFYTKTLIENANNHIQGASGKGLTLSGDELTCLDFKNFESLFKDKSENFK